MYITMRLLAAAVLLMLFTVAFVRPAHAADEIYALNASIIGSIGVVSSSFGFVDLIKRIGIERRLHTAGLNKARLDPFQEERPEDVDHLKEIQEDIYADFTAMVKSRRPEKLKCSDDILFSGDFWAGKRALEYGLIDLGETQTGIDENGDQLRVDDITTQQLSLGLKYRF